MNSNALRFIALIPLRRFCALLAVFSFAWGPHAWAADPAEMRVLISVTPAATSTDAKANVTGGEGPYHYRWALESVDAEQLGKDADALGGVPLKPFERTLIWCKVTDAKGKTAQAFRHVIPLPPGESVEAIKFFGIGDSIENSGGAVDAEQPAVIAVAAQLCEQMMGLSPGAIPWSKCSYPGYTSEEIAKNMPAMLEQIRKFEATDIFIRMGLNDGGNDAEGTAKTTKAVAIAVKEGCPSVRRVWIEPCTGRAESNDRLWKIAKACEAFEESPWLFYTADAAHWHQRRAPNLYPDETHPGPEANRAMGLSRAAAWITKGPPSHPGIGQPTK